MFTAKRSCSNQLSNLTWNHSRGLVVDANFESCGTPINKLNGSLGLDVGDGLVHILGHDITTVQHAAGHVLAMTGIAFDHLIGWLKASIGYLRH